MNPAEIVVHEVNRSGVLVVLQLLAERVREASPVCACGRCGSLPRVSPHRPFYFVGDVLRRHTPPAANLIKQTTVTALGKPSLERRAQWRKAMTVEMARQRFRFSRPADQESQEARRDGKNVKDKSGLVCLLLAFLHDWCIGGLNGLLGNGDDLTHDGVHPHVRVVGTLGLRALLHAETLPTGGGNGSPAVKVAHYPPAVWASLVAPMPDGLASIAVAVQPSQLPHPGTGSADGSEHPVRCAAAVFSPPPHAGPANAFAAGTRPGVSSAAGSVGDGEFSKSRARGSLHAAQPVECIRPAALI